MYSHNKPQRFIVWLILALLVAAVPWLAVGAAPVIAFDTFSCATVTEIPQSECEALVALYNSTNGPGWLRQTGWLATNTPCSWEGVGCEDGHVSNLRLHSNRLSGTIPSALGNLAKLSALYLQINQLSGSIPSELGNLTNLQQLVLYANTLSGPIPPELGNLVSLQQLHLESNQLNGTIPPELGKLPNLLDLKLSFNQLNGKIPPELGTLVSLQQLELNGNQLGGFIPPELGDLTSLQVLLLHDNQLSGPIPRELGNLTNLRRIVLTNNLLSGAIPSELGNLADLQALYLSGNQLSGSIPPELGDLVSLEHLDLVGSQLNGPIPSELGKLSNLQVLELRNNFFSGILPPELGNLVSLQHLDLRTNRLSGPIPPELGNLANLQVLYLNTNNFSGPIPSELGKLVNLQALYLGNTPLSGSIPPELGELANLQELYLNFSPLSGPIPSALGNLTNLKILNLSHNQLSGPLPTELGNLDNLVSLRLNHNRLSGPIPSEIGNLAHLHEFALAANQLSGPIPPRLADLQELATLDLAYNAFTATDATLLSFLAQKAPGWDSTQTVAPTGVQATTPIGDRSTVSWIPILYMRSSGYYEISYATDPAGSFIVHGVTANKLSEQYTITGLTPGATYFVRLRTYTPAHANNQNELWSDYSSVVSATTPVVDNLIVNPSFELGTLSWAFYTTGQGYFNTAGPAYTGNAAMQLNIIKSGKNSQLYQTEFLLEPQTRYRLSFAAYSNRGHDLSVYLHQHSSPYQSYGLKNFRVNLTKSWKIFTVEFTTRSMTSPTTDTRLRFWLAPYATAGDQYWLDAVSLVKVQPTLSAAEASPLVTGNVAGAVQGVHEPVAVTLVDLESGGAAFQTRMMTDWAGLFSFASVPAGTYELSVASPADYLAAEPVQLLVSAEPNEEIIFALEQVTDWSYLPQITR